MLPTLLRNIFAFLRYAYWAVLAGLTGAIASAQRRCKSEAVMEQRLSMAA